MTPSCIAAMNRGGSARDPEHRFARRLPSCRQLLQARPAHGDERVLGGDEEAVQQDERRDGDELEKERSRPGLPGRRVLGRRSFSKEPTAEYR